MEKAQVYAIYKGASISPKKVAPVMDLVRGKSTNMARRVLSFDKTKAAKMILKVLTSAEANVKNNLNMDSSKMYISDLRVDGGKITKRGRITGRYFSPILKRSSHITVGLSEGEGS